MGIKMIKISVCDDDEGQLTFFKQCFMGYNEKHEEKIEANFYQSVQSLLNEKKFSPDVYFLDIELQDGNGLKLAGKIRTRNPQIPIVFITSHEEFTQVIRKLFNVYRCGPPVSVT